ncbi:hypothetical protein FRX31_006590, partial [Thalictrum thalictroides]
NLEEMKKRLKEIEEEAGALREMQAKVEKEMGDVQEDDKTNPPPPALIVVTFLSSRTDLVFRV